MTNLHKKDTLPDDPFLIKLEMGVSLVDRDGDKNNYGMARGLFLVYRLDGIVNEG